MNTEHVSPTTAIEMMLANIWTELLGTPNPSAKENFYEVGGHSLLAVQFVSRVRDELEIDLPLKIFFTSEPNIEEFAKAIEDYIIEQAGIDDANELLKEIEGLSDEEIMALLAETN